VLSMSCIFLDQEVTEGTHSLRWEAALVALAGQAARVALLVVLFHKCCQTASCRRPQAPRHGWAWQYLS